MKRNVLYNLLLLPLAMLIAMGSMSQNLVADQNPNYMTSQEKYEYMADSINRLHGTTPQETYKAIDWMADKKEARDQRRAFRRELRMERARNGWYYNDYNYYYPGYSGNYYYNNYNPYHYYRPRWNNNYWTLVPLAASVGWWLSR